MTKSAIIFFFWFLSSFYIFAQAQFGGRNIGVKEGLSQSSVLSMKQDSFGFIWVGTRDGLNRYDAYSFVQFKYNPGDSSSLKGNVINDIEEMPGGDLWLAHEEGLSRYIRKTDKFKHYLPVVSENVSREFRSVQIIGTDIWAAGWSGLYLYDSETDLFKPFATNQRVDSIFKFSTAEIQIDQDKNYWIASSNHGLFHFDSRWQLKAHFHVDATDPNHKIPRNRIEKLVFDEQGNLYAGTYGGGVFRINKDNIVTEVWSSKSGQGRLLSNDFVRSLAWQDSVNLWIGTFNGVYILNTKSKLLSPLKDRQGNTPTAKTSVRSLYQDRQGIMWVGTYHHAIWQFSTYLYPFFHQTKAPVPDRPESDVIAAFEEDNSNHIYVGTESGWIDIYYPSMKWKSSFKVPSKIAEENTVIKSLWIDSPAQILYIGTLRQGMLRYHIGMQKFLPNNLSPSTEQQVLANGSINSISPGAEDYFWIASDKNGGLHQINKNCFCEIDYPFRESLHNKLANTPLRTIWQDNLGNLWLGTKGVGLIVFHPGRGVILEDRDERFGFIHHINEDKSGNILISTLHEGLIKFNSLSKEKTFLNVNSGLLNNTVFGSLTDKDDQIWVITFGGISKYDPRDSSVKNFYLKNGFPLIEMNEGAFFRAQNGSLLFGGVNGWAALDPGKVKVNDFYPPTVISNLQLFNQNYNSYPGLIDDHLQGIRDLRLRHDQHVLTIELSSLNFLMQENNQYQYMLEGFDKDWINAGTRRSVTYTNLKDGHYVFKYKGSNNDGVFGDQIGTLNIRVLPPPWKSWQALLFYALAIALGIYWVRHNAIKSARLKHDLRIQELENEKIAEAHRMKIRFFTDISHEIRTPLTLIVNPLDELLAKDDLAAGIKKSLLTMKVNISNLLQLVNQLLDLRRIETGHEEVKAEPVIWSELLEQICSGFLGLADQNSIKFERAFNLTELPCFTDPDKIRKLVYNLLSNAFKFTDPGGVISLKAEMIPDKNKPSRILIKVSDTGHGIEPEHLDKVFTRFYKANSQHNAGSGIGLSLVKSIAELMGAEIQLESTPGVGSVFTLEIPTSLYSGKMLTEEISNKGKDFAVVDSYNLEINEILTDAESEEATSQLLIVEDHSELRKYMTQRLSEQYRIKAVSSAEDAIKWLQKKHPDLIISDVMLPGMDGIELCKMLKHKLDTSHIPVILVTARQSESGRMEAIESGADDYLTKPFKFDELQSRINNLILGRKRLRLLYQKERVHQVDTAGIGAQDQLFLQSLDALILESIEKPEFNIESLSKSMNLSRVHLYRKLKAITGMSPSTYVRWFRVRKAADILLNSDKRVSEVAYMVGFQDIAYFSKCFKQLFKVLPSEYKSSINAEK